MEIFLQDGKINCLPEILSRKTIFPFYSAYKEIGYLTFYQFKMVFIDIESTWELLKIIKDITLTHNSYTTYEDVIFILNLNKYSFKNKTQLKSNELQRNEENNKRSEFKLAEFDCNLEKYDHFLIELNQLLQEYSHLIFNFPYEIRNIENDFKFINLNNYCLEINEFKQLNKPNWTLRDLLEINYGIPSKNNIWDNYEIFYSQIIESIIVQNLKLQLFDFGKYKDQSLFSIVKSDSTYIMWCFKNIKRFNISYLFPVDWWYGNTSQSIESLFLKESKRILIQIFGDEIGNKIFIDSKGDYLNENDRDLYKNGWVDVQFFSTLAEREGSKKLQF